MPEKVQFNPSTQKVLFNPSTQKVQTALVWECGSYECGDCFSDCPPKYYTVTFSGVTLCSGFNWPGGVDLNATWKLTQYYTAGAPVGSRGCRWRYTDANWNISLVLWNGGNQIILKASGGPGLDPYFQHPVNFPESCDIEDEWDNGNYCGPPDNHAAYQGTGKFCPGWRPEGCP